MVKERSWKVLFQVTGLFLKLGTISFGGPAAHIALIEQEVVRKRGWLDREHFLDLLAATNLVPGPNATEMAIHIGYVRATGMDIPHPDGEWPKETHKPDQRKRIEFEELVVLDSAGRLQIPRDYLETLNIGDRVRLEVKGADIVIHPVAGRGRTTASELALPNPDELYVDEEDTAPGKKKRTLTARLRHHHFPCLASLGIDPDYGDTLMHISGNILRDEVGEQVKPYKHILYIAPGQRSEDPS